MVYAKVDQFSNGEFTVRLHDADNSTLLVIMGTNADLYEERCNLQDYVYRTYERYFGEEDPEIKFETEEHKCRSY